MLISPHCLSNRVLCSCLCFAYITNSAISKEIHTFTSRQVEPKAYAAFGAAIIARNRGDDDSALRHLKSGLKHDPESFTILGEIADIHHNRGKINKAIDYYRKVLSYSPKDLRANRELGQIYFRKKKLELAETHLLRAIQNSPRKNSLRFLLATSYRLQGKLSECAEQYEAVLLSSPHLTSTSQALADVYKDLSINIEQVESEAKNSDDKNFVKYFKLAHAFLAEKKIEKTIEALESAIKIEPRWISGYVILGHFYLEVNRAPDAIRVYNQVYEIAPNRLDLLYRVSEIYFLSNDFLEAAGTLERIRAIKPKFEQTLYRLSYCYHFIGELDKTIKVANQYLKLFGDSSEPTIYELLGTSHAMAGRRDKANEYVLLLREILNNNINNDRFVLISQLLANLLTELNDHQGAIKALEDALNRNPNHQKLRLDLAGLYDQKKMDGKAEQMLKKALEAEPTNAKANNHLGYFYAVRGRNLDEAVLLVKKALKVEPLNWAYLDSLGWAYFKLGRIDESLKLLQKAIAIQDDSIVRDHLGDAYREKGNVNKAHLHWKRALELDPQLETVKQKILEVTGPKK